MKTGIYWQDPKYALKPGQDFIFDPSLVLYLPLHQLDGASFISKDAYGHLCTVTGALWTPNGREFDASDDKITVPDHSVLDITDDLTVEGWVKLLNTGGNNSVMGKASTIWTQVSYLLQIFNHEHPTFGLSSDGGVPSYLDSNVVVEADSWYHLVGTFARPNRVIFIDGVQKNSDSWDNDIHIGTADLYIGKYTGTSNTLDGMVGEVRIYNRALTPLEIQQNYLATKWRYQ